MSGLCSRSSSISSIEVGSPRNSPINSDKGVSDNDSCVYLRKSSSEVEDDEFNGDSRAAVDDIVEQTTEDISDAQTVVQENVRISNMIEVYHLLLDVSCTLSFFNFFFLHNNKSTLYTF